MGFEIWKEGKLKLWRKHCEGRGGGESETAK